MLKNADTGHYALVAVAPFDRRCRWSKGAADIVRVLTAAAMHI